MSVLICPICGSPLSSEGGSLICASGRRHCFDRAKSGYVNLSPDKPGAGDDRQMVRARSEFLNRGYYFPLAGELLGFASGNETVIDCGCGDGYYSVKIAETGAALYGFDLSKHACEKAAKRAGAAGVNAFFGVASVFSLPVEDSSADMALSIFAPLAEKELSRILKDGGRLIIVAAGKRHLYEFKAAMYDEIYENEGRRDLPVGFMQVGKRNLTYTFTCDGADLNNLLMMTPYAFKTSRRDAEKLAKIQSLEITADFDIFIYQKTTAQDKERNPQK